MSVCSVKCAVPGRALCVAYRCFGPSGGRMSARTPGKGGLLFTHPERAELRYSHRPQLFGNGFRDHKTTPTCHAQIYKPHLWPHPFPLCKSYSLFIVYYSSSFTVG